LDSRLTGQNGREFPTTPLGMHGPVLQGVLIDEAIEVLFQLARHFGRSPGARAIKQALGPLLRKALHPLTVRPNLEVNPRLR
jgi:hypothetical protein